MANLGPVDFDARLNPQPFRSDLQRIEQDADQTIARIRAKFQQLGLGGGGNVGGAGGGGGGGGIHSTGRLSTSNIAVGSALGAVGGNYLGRQLGEAGAVPVAAVPVASATPMTAGGINVVGQLSSTINRGFDGFRGFRNRGMGFPAGFPHSIDKDGDFVPSRNQIGPRGPAVVLGGGGNRSGVTSHTGGEMRVFVVNWPAGLGGSGSGGGGNEHDEQAGGVGGGGGRGKPSVRLSKAGSAYLGIAGFAINSANVVSREQSNFLDAEMESRSDRQKIEVARLQRNKNIMSGTIDPFGLGYGEMASNLVYRDSILRAKGGIMVRDALEDHSMRNKNIIARSDAGRGAAFSLSPHAAAFNASEAAHRATMNEFSTENEERARREAIPGMDKAVRDQFRLGRSMAFVNRDAADRGTRTALGLEIATLSASNEGKAMMAKGEITGGMAHAVGTSAIAKFNTQQDQADEFLKNGGSARDAAMLRTRNKQEALGTQRDLEIEKASIEREFLNGRGTSFNPTDIAVSSMQQLGTEDVGTKIQRLTDMIDKLTQAISARP